MTPRALPFVLAAAIGVGGAATTAVTAAAGPAGVSVASTAATTSAATARAFAASALASAASAAPTRASVASAPATSITPTGATLAASINPRGQRATYSFQYGTDRAALTGSTPSAEIGPDGAALPVSYPLSGLQPNTRYYFRAVATNPTGVTNGRTRTFVTTRSVAGVSVKAARRFVLFGSSTVLSGVVSGAGVGGVRVALMRQDFPFAAAPVEVATMTTSETGAYTFSVGPIKAAANLWVQTRTEPMQSSKLVDIHSTLSTRLKIISRTAKGVKVRGTAFPRIPAGRVYLQRRAAGGWVSVAKPKLARSGPADRSSFTATISRKKGGERYRAIIDPNDSGAHQRTTTDLVVVPRR